MISHATKMLFTLKVIQGEMDEGGFCAAAFLEENEKKNQNQHIIPCKFSFFRILLL